MTDELDRVWSLSPGPELNTTGFDLFGHHGTAPCSAFDTETAAEVSSFAAHIALAEVGVDRGLELPRPVLSREHALASFSGFVEVNSTRLPKWGGLSGSYRTGDDRWIQLHCNFPHHAAGAAAALGVAEDRDQFERAILGREALELEADLIDRGMIGAAYRTLGEWNEHPHAEATFDLPLMSVEQIGDADPRVWPEPVDRPLDGIRVLDCSRVLAGPVAGQTLASAGADVLRVGAEHLPSVDVGVISTGFGKRNCFIDLRTPGGRSEFDDLLKTADVFIDAFRPGALEALGYSLDRISELSPGISVVQICAFDWIGPWAGRRGFDSIVQSTTGIALAGSWWANAAGQVSDPDHAPPRHLPVQVLDYATGFLSAHSAARMLRNQQLVGGSWLMRLSLLRTRNWFVGLGGPKPFEPAAVTVPSDYLATVTSDFGEVTAVTPMTGRWDLPPSRLGSSPAAWSA